MGFGTLDEIRKLKQMMWDAYGILGFDTDGDETPDACVGWPHGFLAAVREARSAADAAQREAQEQRERADRLEAALLDRRQGYDAPVPGLAEARGRIAVLEAALRKWQRLTLVGESSIREEVHRDERAKPTYLDVCDAIALTRAALAAQPAPCSGPDETLALAMAEFEKWKEGQR